MKQRRKQKNSDVKEKRLPIKKQSEHRYCEFYYDFGRFSMDFEEKRAKREQFFSVKTG